MRRLVVTILLLAAAIVPAASAAAAPAPAWSIVAIPYPTNFTPGASGALGNLGYLVIAKNVGGAPTNGGFTVADKLPAALKPSAGRPPSGFYGPKEGGTLNCEVSGRTITCTGATPALEPGGQAFVRVPVDVESSAGPVAVNRASVSGGGAGSSAETVQPTTVSAAPAAFGFPEGPTGLFGVTTSEDGSTATQAGSHPYQQTIAAATFATIPRPGVSEVRAAGGGVRDVVAELPSGTVVNPAATPVRCTETELEGKISGCPEASQIGTIVPVASVLENLTPAMKQLYNMVPPPGYAAELAFEVVEGTYVHLLGSVRSDGSFVLSAGANDIVAKVAIGGEIPMLWGNPSDPSHDPQRGECLNTFGPATCPTERTNVPFVSLPSSCGSPLLTSIRADSWLEPGNFVTRSSESTDLQTGAPVGVTGCSQLAFEPTIQSRSTTSTSDSPAGLDFDLNQPQHEAANELSTANLKNVSVTLPQGFVLNPSAGSGLEGCSTSQIGLSTGVGASPIRFAETPPNCPNASKIGTVEVTSPVLKDDQAGGRKPVVLPGSVYLAKPFDNPFGSLLGVYVVVDDQETGILAKLPGRVEPNQSNGQLTAIFKESPQLPLSDVKLHLFGGPRASLTTPISCGTATTNSTLTPWTTPEGADATAADSFAVTSAPGGGDCPSSESQAPNHPGFMAGTMTPVAGGFSPFVLKLNREDGSQRVVAIDTTLPEGLTGKLAGIPYCPEDAIAAAQRRSNPNEGADEIAHPSCPAASEVGSVDVAAGSGPTPLHVAGHAYLAGPYKGAPISLVVVTPAVAGPFDLGVVVTRVALQVNLETAQIHAVSDPLPTFLQGIPLDVRSITLNMDRPNFVINPTSCEPKAITGSATSATGASAPLSQRFQVAGCDKLGFKPSLKVSLKGGTKRAGHPALKAVVTYPKKGAYTNIARAQVGLPHSEFLDQGNLNKVCTQPELRSDSCPARSVYGHAKAWTPLLDKPLEGPVYLAVGFGYKLPALVADLNGQVRIFLKGKIDTTKHGGIRNTFEAVPDAPISRFVLEMKGGKKYGLLENSENICRNPQKASAVFKAQTGKTLHLQPKIAISCKKGKANGKKGTKGKKGTHRPSSQK
jgi:hypothetical protein